MMMKLVIQVQFYVDISVGSCSRSTLSPIIVGSVENHPKNQRKPSYWRCSPFSTEPRLWDHGRKDKH